MTESWVPDQAESTLRTILKTFLKYCAHSIEVKDLTDVILNRQVTKPIKKYLEVN